jgi:hypothetical protein
VAGWSKPTFGAVEAAAVPAAPTLDHLTSLLSAAFGRPVGLAALDRVGSWPVLRCRLEPGAGLPPSVIAKWLRDEPSSRADPRQLATERAALEFLEEIGFRGAPRLIASDSRVVILEDLARSVALADRLRAEGANSLEGELRAFARTLGELGAVTAGREAHYERIRRHAGHLGGPTGNLASLDPAWPTVRRRLADLGLEMSSAAEREQIAIAEAFATPGPFHVFTNGDPHPNNYLVGEGAGHLIDFELAGFVHALSLAVWIHVPDPAWISAGQSMSAGLELAFRAALSAGVPEAEDDHRFGYGLAACCIAWAQTRLVRFETLDGRPRGDRSRLQIVTTLELAAAAARRHRALPALAGWMERAGAWLRRRWPDAEADLATYPAFTPR